MKTPQETMMFQEAQGAADATRLHLDRAEEIIDRLLVKIFALSPRFVVTCARGSSDHAATFAKYLIETRLGLPVVSLAPSIASLFDAPIQLSGSLFIAISQSGGGPDLVASARKARSQGALVVGLINARGSVLQKECDYVVPLYAGPEKSVAATKSYILSLVAISHLVAKWTQDRYLHEGLEKLPDTMETAWGEDWSAGTRVLATTANLFTVSRGLGLAIAQEAALKFKETSGMHAEGFSSAEVKHGPMALIKDGFTVLLFASHDLPEDHHDQMVADFIARGATVLSAGQNHRDAIPLPVPKASDPVFSYILMILAFYRMANAVSLKRGHDPDEPPFLKKVTETL